jgi:hypothetical protein
MLGIADLNYGDYVKQSIKLTVSADVQSNCLMPAARPRNRGSSAAHCESTCIAQIVHIARMTDQSRGNDG